MLAILNIATNVRMSGCEGWELTLASDSWIALAGTVFPRFGAPGDLHARAPATTIYRSSPALVRAGSGSNAQHCWRADTFKPTTTMSRRTCTCGKTAGIIECKFVHLGV